MPFTLFSEVCECFGPFGIEAGRGETGIDGVECVLFFGDSLFCVGQAETQSGKRWPLFAAADLALR